MYNVVHLDAPRRSYFALMGGFYKKVLSEGYAWWLIKSFFNQIDGFSCHVNKRKMLRLFCEKLKQIAIELNLEFNDPFYIISLVLNPVN